MRKNILWDIKYARCSCAFILHFIIKIIMGCGVGTRDKPRLRGTGFRQSVIDVRAISWSQTRTHISIYLNDTFILWPFFGFQQSTHWHVQLGAETVTRWKLYSISDSTFTRTFSVEMQCVQFAVADIVFNVGEQKNPNAPTTNWPNRSLVHYARQCVCACIIKLCIQCCRCGCCYRCIDDHFISIQTKYCKLCAGKRSLARRHPHSHKLSHKM